MLGDCVWGCAMGLSPTACSLCPRSWTGKSSSWSRMWTSAAPRLTPHPSSWWSAPLCTRWAPAASPPPNSPLRTPPSPCFPTDPHHLLTTGLGPRIRHQHRAPGGHGVPQGGEERGRAQGQGHPICPLMTLGCPTAAQSHRGLTDRQGGEGVATARQLPPQQHQCG